MAEQVVVTVDAIGDVKVEAQGVKGSGCAALTSAIERAIGSTTADQRKPEFLQGASCSVPNQAKAGQ